MRLPSVRSGARDAVDSQTAQAMEDLIEVAGYLAETSTSACDRFLQQAQTQFEILARSPGLGRERSFRSARLRRVRSCAIRGFGNYLVFYRPTATHLVILRVLHGMRDIDSIFDDGTH